MEKERIYSCCDIYKFDKKVLNKKSEWACLRMLLFICSLKLTIYENKNFTFCCYFLFYRYCCKCANHWRKMFIRWQFQLLQFHRQQYQFNQYKYSIWKGHKRKHRCRRHWFCCRQQKHFRRPVIPFITIVPEYFTANTSRLVKTFIFCRKQMRYFSIHAVLEIILIMLGNHYMQIQTVWCWVIFPAFLIPQPKGCKLN